MPVAERAPGSGLPKAMRTSHFPYAMRRLRRLAARDCVQIRFLDALDEVPVDVLMAANAAVTHDCRRWSNREQTGNISLSYNQPNRLLSATRGESARSAGVGRMDDRGDAGRAGDSYPLPPRLAAILDHLPLDQLAFTPVPMQARRDGWTAARQTGFIHRLAICGCVGTSARGVGMSRESAWRLRKRPGAGSFAAAWDEAARWGSDHMSDLGIERCLKGEVRPYYYRGRKVGVQVRFNDSLLIAVLNRFERPRRLPCADEDPVLALDRALANLAARPPLKTKDFPGESP